MAGSVLWAWFPKAVTAKTGFAATGRLRALLRIHAIGLFC